MKRFLDAWPAWLVAAVWLAPLVSLAGVAMDGGGRGMWWWLDQRGWRIAAANTIEQTVMVAGLAVPLGWGIGFLTGIASRGWRVVIQGICVLPLVVPPFLWAIGWSFWKSRVPQSWYPLFDGQWGMVCSGLFTAATLSVLAVSVAAGGVPRAQWEFALTTAGRWRTRLLAARRVGPVAIGAAVMGALIGVADAGAGQIMGRHGMAGEVLVSLAKRQDIGEAAAKSFASALLLLPLTVLTAWLLSKAWASRQTGRAAVRGGGIPKDLSADWLVCQALLLFVMVSVALPVWGLTAPMQRPRSLEYLTEAVTIWKSSLGPTLWYSVGSGAVASAGGAVLACFGAGRVWFMGLCLMALSVPSTMRALGWMTAAGQWNVLRPVLNAEAGIAFVLGVQWLPLAALLLAPAIAALPVSWNHRRQLAAVSRFRYAVTVLLPVLAPRLALALISCALFSLADVTSLMLLQPPGSTAFTSHVFAVMDNSPEIIVASRCLLLLPAPLVLGAALLVAVWLMQRSKLSPQP